MAKRYYWLKLKEDFFDDDTMQYIEEQENGIHYSNFYMKLCLKSLKSEGKLIRLIGDTLIPYDVKSLSKLTGVDIDTVRVAMALFERIGLVKILDTGELYLTQMQEMIGSETDKAQIMRRKRAEEKSIGNNVTHMLPECYTEIEKEIEIDLDNINNVQKEDFAPSENKKEKINKQEIEVFFERVWKMYPSKKGKQRVSDKQKKILFEIGQEELERAIKRYVDDWEKEKDWRKQQNGSTFFNSGYVDYLDDNYQPSKGGDEVEQVRRENTESTQPTNGIVDALLGEGYF